MLKSIIKESAQPFTCNKDKEVKINKLYSYLLREKERLSLFVRDNDLTIDKNYKEFEKLQEINFKLLYLNYYYLFLKKEVQE